MSLSTKHCHLFITTNATHYEKITCIKINSENIMKYIQ